MGKNLTFGLAVTISEADANAIVRAVPGAGSNEQKLGTIAAGLLKDLAGGGCMIRPEYAQRIETVIGKADDVAIVEHVERAVNKDGETTLVEWRVDPTQIAFYQMLADNNNCSLEQELKSVMDLAYDQGWLGSAAPDVFKILLTQDQFRVLQQRFAKDLPTGEDVMLALEGVGAAFEPDGGPDFVEEVLKG